MDWGTLIMIVGALGGFEGIKYFLNWKSNKRKSEAEAKRDEVSARALEYDLHRKQMEDLQKRLDKRDEKVDFLYTELRDKENTILRMTAEANINDLKYTNAEEWRCNILDCFERHPPKDYKHKMKKQ